VGGVWLRKLEIVDAREEEIAGKKRKRSKSLVKHKKH